MANTQIVVARKNVEPQYVEMMVPLYSYGCERKVKKTLSHLKGIYSVTVDYNQQKVTVWGICNKYDVLSTMRSKRKEARFWKPEDNTDQMEDDDDDDDDVIQTQEQEQEQEQQPPSLPNPNKDFKPSSLALRKARSLNWKTWKKVFTRSYSF